MSICCAYYRRWMRRTCANLNLHNASAQNAAKALWDRCQHLGVLYLAKVHRNYKKEKTRENPGVTGVLFSHGLAKFVLKFRKWTSEARISSRPWCWPSLLVGQSHSTADSLAQQIDMSSDQVTCRFDTFWHGKEIASVIQFVQLWSENSHISQVFTASKIEYEAETHMIHVCSCMHTTYNISLCQF